MFQDCRPSSEQQQGGVDVIRRAGSEKHARERKSGRVNGGASRRLNLLDVDPRRGDPVRRSNGGDHEARARRAGKSEAEGETEEQRGADDNLPARRKPSKRGIFLFFWNYDGNKK